MSGSTVEEQLKSSISQIDTLQPKLEILKSQVSTFITNVHESVVSKRSEYEKQIVKLKATESKLLQEIKSTQDARQKLMEELAKEIADRDAASLNIKEMKLQQENLMVQNADFTKKLAEIGEQISEKLKEINEQRQLIRNQTSIIADKLYQFEQLLGLKIENGSSKDDKNHLIKFIFSNVDPEDFSREVFFVLDPEQLLIVETFPQLDNPVIDEAISQFVETKEIGKLWKSIRSALKAAIL